MKINFVSFLNPYRFNGGGELDNRMLLEEGKKMGLDIRAYARVSNKYIHRLIKPVRQLHNSPDIWILADLFNVPEYGLSYDKGFLEEIINNQPYIHLDNAYVDICSKGALPCKGNKQNCVTGCGHGLSYELYKKSLLNVFLSPLHERTINGYFNNEFVNRSYVLRPLVDVTRFYNMHRERDIDYVYVGTISEYKGYSNIESRFGKERNFLFIGKNATGRSLFGRHIPYIENDQLITYLNRAKNFVHLPEWKEPMGRTVIEAALCGCGIIHNENVGACSFDFDIADPANIRHSSKDFWSRVREIVASTKNTVC